MLDGVVGVDPGDEVRRDLASSERLEVGVESLDVRLTPRALDLSADHRGKRNSARFVLRMVGCPRVHAEPPLHRGPQAHDMEHLAAGVVSLSREAEEIVHLVEQLRDDHDPATRDDRGDNRVGNRPDDSSRFLEVE